MSTKLLITDTTLRDAHQSLIATRLKTEDMIPLARVIDKVGFFSVEAWGGATFDSSIRFLAEDPWDRVRLLHDELKHTPIQMLLRGQNLVGYRHYPDDVVQRFVELSHKNGVDIFRVFDALNDIRNMSESMRMVRKVGAHLQGALCYTTSPVNSIPGFIDMAKELYAHDCDSLCIKDMAGLIMPEAARELITGIKDEIDTKVDLHSHSTSGIASMSYQAAIEAGVDILDTAMSPFALGTSQPPTEIDRGLPEKYTPGHRYRSSHAEGRPEHLRQAAGKVCRYPESDLRTDGQRCTDLSISRGDDLEPGLPAPGTGCNRAVERSAGRDPPCTERIWGILPW